MHCLANRAARTHIVWLVCWAAFAGILWPTAVRAQLGEERSAIAKRYGPAVRSHARVREHRILEGTTADSDVHEKDGCYVRVVYGQGRAVQLEFSKKEGAFRPEDIEKLLAANADDSKWEQGKNSTEAIRFYRRLDGRAVASWTTDFHGSLLISLEKIDDMTPKLLSISGGDPPP